MYNGWIQKITNTFSTKNEVNEQNSAIFYIYCREIVRMMWGWIYYYANNLNRHSSPTNILMVKSFEKLIKIGETR